MDEIPQTRERSQKNRRALNFDFSRAAKGELRYFDKIAKHLMSEMALAAISNNEISFDGKDESTAQLELSKLLKKKLRYSPIYTTIDHTHFLLRQARQHARECNSEVAALFYVTYVEHKLNWFIMNLSVDRQLSRRTITQILRETPIRSKASWLLEVLGAKSIPKGQEKTLADLTEHRNKYVHYKWPIDNVNDKFALSEKQKFEKIIMLKRAESLVRYLRSFENKWMHGGQGARVRKILSSKKVGQ